jgi:hypothetical protein
MIRVYNCYRNMDAKDRAEKPVSIELLQLPSVFCWLVFELHEAVLECCGLLHHTPIPKWLANLQGKWGCECSPPNSFPLHDEGCTCGGRFGDYYGDTWGDMWHCFLEIPLQEYLTRRLGKTERPYLFIEMPLSYWDHVPNDPDVKWIRDDIEREKGYDVDELGNSLAPRHCEYPGRTWLYKLVEWLTRPWRTPPCDGT